MLGSLFFSYTAPLFYFIITRRWFNVNIFFLIEHEYMGPKWAQTEGRILGTAAKMFTIAGPVIVYGITAGVVYGLVHWIVSLVM